MYAAMTRLPEVPDGAGRVRGDDASPKVPDGAGLVRGYYVLT